MVLIESANVLVFEVIANLLDGLELEVDRRARMEEGAYLLILSLTSLPLQQKFTQTFSGRLVGKTSEILILGL